MDDADPTADVEQRRALHTSAFSDSMSILVHGRGPFSRYLSRSDAARRAL
jgi:hypothetical protein